MLLLELVIGISNDQTNKRTSQSWRVLLKRPRNAQWKCLLDL
jgi:hypothetical protein